MGWVKLTWGKNGRMKIHTNIPGMAGFIYTLLKQGIGREELKRRIKEEIDRIEREERSNPKQNMP